MAEINCHTCGGFVVGQRYVSYRLPELLVPRLEPSGAACLCQVPVIYGPPPGHRSQAAIPIPRFKLDE